MKLTLNNEADVFAVGELAGLQNGGGIVLLLAAYAAAEGDGETEFIATINRELLGDTYRGNPSLLAAKVLVRLQCRDGDWESCSGHLTSETHVSVRLSKMPKQRYVRSYARPSVKGTIKEWIDLKLHKSKRLKLPISTIPAWYMSHPEQLTYTIKQETQVAIKITKLTGSWLISRR